MTYKTSQDLTSGYISDPLSYFSPKVLPHSSHTSLFLFPRTPSFFIPSYMHIPPAPALSWLDSIINSTEQTLGGSGEQKSLAFCIPGLQRVRPNLVTEQQEQYPYIILLMWNTILNLHVHEYENGTYGFPFLTDFFFPFLNRFLRSILGSQKIEWKLWSYTGSSILTSPPE